MGDLVIQTHSFENSKRQLKKFSEQTTTDLDLERVDTAKGFGELLFGGGFGLNHRVTGDELNSLTSQIQTHLIDINTLQRKFIQEFGQVYNALEALDRDYIQAILIAIKSAQKANEDVRIAQGDIEKTITMQKKTIKVLEQFKVKIDKNQHLADIDMMWRGIEKAQADIAGLGKSFADAVSSMASYAQEIESINNMKVVIDSLRANMSDYNNNLTSLAETVDHVHVEVSEQKKTVSMLEQFKRQNDKYKHLADVDNMWQDIQKAQTEITVLGDSLERAVSTITSHSQELESNLTSLAETADRVHIEISEQQKSISIFDQFKSQMDKHKHLPDIDNMWQDIQNVQTNITALGESLKDAVSSITSHTQELESMNHMKSMIDSLEHLKDIDSLWDKMSDYNNNLTSLAVIAEQLQVQINEQNVQVELFAEFKERIDKLEHLYDVDHIWSSAKTLQEKMKDTQAAVVQHSEAIIDFSAFKSTIERNKHIKDIDSIYGDCQVFKTDITKMKETITSQEHVIYELKGNLVKEQKKAEELEKTLFRRIKIAYFLAGGSIGLVVIELILIMLRLL